MLAIPGKHNTDVINFHAHQWGWAEEISLGFGKFAWGFELTLIMTQYLYSNRPNNFSSCIKIKAINNHKGVKMNKKKYKSETKEGEMNCTLLEIYLDL